MNKSLLYIRLLMLFAIVSYSGCSREIGFAYKDGGLEVLLVEQISEISLGNKVTLKASFSDSSGRLFGDGLPFKWTSSNTDVLVVNSSGELVPIKVGVATISVEFLTQNNTFSNSFNVTVVEPLKGAERFLINISINSLTLMVGQDHDLDYEFSETLNTENMEVNWESSDPEIVSINEQGVVDGLAIGIATVSVSLDYQGETYDDSIDVNVVNRIALE